MGASPSDRVRFFGRVTSVVTHELMNVFAIIRETAGLVEDLLLMARSGREVSQEKLLEKLATVKKQVDRGAALTASLNCFSHSPDQASVNFDAYKTAEQLVFLTSRMARSKNIELEVAEPTGPCPVNTSSVGFQMILFLSLELLTELSEEGARLSIAVSSDESATTVSISPGQENGGKLESRVTASGQWQEVTDLCAEIGAVALVDPCDRAIKTVFKRG